MPVHDNGAGAFLTRIGTFLTRIGTLHPRIGAFHTRIGTLHPPGPTPFSPASAATFDLSGASTGQPWPESARAARATPPHGFPAASLRPENCANITAMSSRSSRAVRPAGGTLRFNIRLNASRSPAAVVT